MGTVLYEKVTNNFARNALARSLYLVVAATIDTAKLATVPPTNYATLKTDQAERLVDADPTLIQVVEVPNDEKHKFVMATQAGIDAVNASEPIVEAFKTPVVAGSFKIESGVPLPAIKRGGMRAQMYPFDHLEIGQSFFVPVTETIPNPGKTLASTVSSATRRFKANGRARVFTIRANEDEFPTATDKGRKGARIWRIKPEEATPEQAAGTDATAAPAA
jgi:hypothetical protein